MVSTVSESAPKELQMDDPPLGATSGFSCFGTRAKTAPPASFNRIQLSVLSTNGTATIHLILAPLFPWGAPSLFAHRPGVVNSLIN
jgi:hypothetical protein